VVHVGAIFLADERGHHGLLPEGEATTQQGEGRGGDGHDAEPAGLDEEQHEDLSEKGQVRGGVHDDEAGHARGTHGGERGVEDADAASPGRAPRQGQGERAEHAQSGEGDDEQAGGMLEEKGDETLTGRGRRPERQDGAGKRGEGADRERPGRDEGDGGQNGDGGGCSEQGHCDPHAEQAVASRPRFAHP
jgi:hypothetical protein